MTKQFVIAYDLDDVLCYRDVDPSTEQIIGPDKYKECVPITEMIKIVNECYNAGYKIVIYTARGMSQFSGDAQKCDKELREITIHCLKKWGVKYHELIFGKIHYDLIIDDKAQNSVNIKNFKDIEKWQTMKKKGPGENFKTY